MNTAQFHCIICGNELPLSARAGETAGPLICERHGATDPEMAGVVGFQNLESESPVAQLTAAVRGQRLVAARLLVDSLAMDVVLELDAGVLDLFPLGHFTAFAQYIPRTSISTKALNELPLAVEGPDTKPVFDAIRARARLLGTEPGAYTDGSVATNILALRFEGDFVLDVEAIGSTVATQEQRAYALVFSWRKDRAPGPSGGGAGARESP
jgi:hypothetical protein